jgi:hypothetical protein
MASKKKKRKKQAAPFQLRLDDELTKLADAVTELASERALVKVTKSSVLRAAMMRGLYQIHEELLRSL